jgi:hypothetical protein
MANLRLAYAIEFLLALIATFTVWNHVAAQGDLDVMAWYWKLLLGGGIAVATVKATAAAVESEQTWNPRTLRWLAVIITLAIGCGVVTYYYHLYAPADEEDETVTQSGAVVRAPLPPGIHITSSAPGSRRRPGAPT